MTSEFIPLGFHCNVSMLTEQLQIKKETSLFEWVESKQLGYITDVINSIKINIDRNIVQGRDGLVHFLYQDLHTSRYGVEGLYTCHYKLEEYRNIFERRAARFLEQIRNSSEIIFIRINSVGATPTTVEEINNFCEAIHSINSNLKITFLLIKIVKNMDDNNELPLLKNINLIQKYFLHEDCNGDEYLKNNPKLCDIFYKFLLEAGYVPTEKCNKQFGDRD
jgi:hypothetical protein